jgi:RimJ/RimL family protein N-acetyltransferase
MLAALPPEEQAFLSADWLEQLRTAKSATPWNCTFRILRLADSHCVGEAGFKAPPTLDGQVEIAYGIVPENQGRGYATEAARALIDYAFGLGEVRVVRAHTLPESNASTRVLIKAGFQKIGLVVDLEDGPVWRWELAR